MKVIRSEEGKTYGASSSFEAHRSRGHFLATTFTRNAETVPTLELLIGEIRRMRDEGPTPAEVADAKANLAGRYPLAFQGASDVVSRVLAAELHDLGEDYVREFPVRVSRVSVEDVKAAAKRRLDPDNLVVVIVGSAAEVEPQLRKAGIAYEKVGHLEPISKQDREAKVAARNAPPDPKAAARGRALLDEALRAKGGRDKVAGIKDLTVTGKVKVSFGPQAIEGDFERIFRADGSLRLQIATPMGDIVVLVTPEGAWQMGGGHSRAVPKDEADEQRASVWRDRDLILLRHLDKETFVEARPPETVGGVAYDVVVLRKGDGTYETKLLLDPRSKTIFRIVYDEKGATSTEEYRDYKQVDGILFSFTQHHERQGQTIDATLTDIKVNAGYPPDTFKAPK
jgi:outer membrane lipoprotein-sorting protein